MTPTLFLLVVGGYFLSLLAIGYFTSKKSDNDSYFLGNKSSPWLAVAFGLIGDSLSGVTFISVPGSVGTNQFSYFQLVLGYVVGYFIISRVLLPVYYSRNLTSIYSFLGERIGYWSQRTGSFYFLLSRTLGAAARLFLAVSVLQVFVFDDLGVPFWLTVLLFIGLILAYTLKGGIKTLVWTDTFQSAFLLLGVIVSVIIICSKLDMNFTEMAQSVYDTTYSKVFFWDWRPKNFFFKQFIGGAFIAIVMTGLDQNMMQKSLSCKSLKDAQKNLEVFGFVVVGVNLLFLCLGALLFLYNDSLGLEIPNYAGGGVATDYLFPNLALNHMGTVAAVVFVLGLSAATFSSSDSVLTTLTTSFYIDFLGYDKRSDVSAEQKMKVRKQIHMLFAFVLFLVIIAFNELNSQAIITTVLVLAGYTYGPLLGLYAFGIFSKKVTNDKLVPFICVISPIITFIINQNGENWFNGYQFSFELLLVNGLITFIALHAFSKKTKVIANS